MDEMQKLETQIIAHLDDLRIRKEAFVSSGLRIDLAKKYRDIMCGLEFALALIQVIKMERSNESIEIPAN